MKDSDLKVINSDYRGFKVIKVFYDEKCDARRKRKAICLCDCGVEFISRVDSLKNRIGCRKCGQKHGGKNRILPNFQAAKTAYFKSYEVNAKNRNLEFNISFDEFSDIISNKCYYCGMSPQDQSYLSKSTRKYGKFYASGIDRMCNEKGYTMDNIVPCCTKCNMMKKTLSCDEFTDHIQNIYEHLKYNVDNTIFKIYE